MDESSSKHGTVPGGDTVKADSNSTYKMELRENCTAIDGLRRSQTYTAHFLHLSFLAASNDPEISKAIRLTAHRARVEHGLALELMERFSANANHVVRRLLPIVLEGIDIDCPDLITGAFDEIKNVAEQMHSEAKETTTRYIGIHKEVQEKMGDISTKVSKLQTFLEQLSIRKKEAEAKVKIEAEHMDRICKEKKTYLEELPKSGDNERNNDRASDIFTCMTFPATLITGISVTGGLAGSLIGAACFGVNYWNENRKTKDKHDHTAGVVNRIAQAEDRIQEQRKKELDAVSQLEELALAEDNAADSTGLKNAYDGLGQAYEQLERLTNFWRSIVIYIDAINKDIKVAQLYAKHSKLLRAKVQQSERNWQTFITVCDKYVSVCKNHDTESVRKLYAYLSEPIDSMTKADRRKRQIQIAEELKKMIGELGNE